MRQLHRAALALLAALALDALAADPQLRLPASFSGRLPCADCEAIAAHLDLWPDGVFLLRREPVGKPGRDDDRGRWRKDPSRPVILLYGGREAPLQFEIAGPDALRPLDVRGAPLGPAHELRSDGALRPAELELRLHGMFRYFADSARFEDCLTGRNFPVAMEGDYLALERAYMAAKRPAPGAPIMASFEGALALRPPMEGPRPVQTILVRRFIGVFPGQTCERAMATASLGDQYWRVVSLRGRKVSPPPRAREPHLILRSREGYAVSGGCPAARGSVRIDGNRIAFAAPEPGAAPCEGKAAELHRTLVDALTDARSWSIHAQVLELFDANGAPLAVLEAVYLR
jgi:uncharacterized lipoprotein NlpE involved in copper resistance/heat shock protein HslJ